MASSRIASRYSRSLIDLATEAGSLDQVKADMELVHGTCVESKELLNLLKNPVVKAADKKAVIGKVFKDVSQLSMSMLNFMVDKRREDSIPTMAEQFVAAYDRIKGISKATVVSASPLSQESMDRIRTYVQGLVGNTQLLLHNEIDASIIGGVVIRHEDRLLDMSVARELREIRKELIFN